MAELNQNNNLEKQNDNNDLDINLKKIINIIWYRRNIIIGCYLIIILIAVLYSFLGPKKYTVNAEIFINKSASTNLAEVNPFQLTTSGLSSSSSKKSLASMISGGAVGIEDEMKILESPLVMDKVIIENNLRYTKGPRKGEFLTASDFLGKNLKVKNFKQTNFILVSYKSNDPELSYNIVNSVIKNYIDAYININSAKATTDRKFIKKFYEETRTKVLEKANEIKEFKIKSPDNLMENIYISNVYQGLSTKHDKRVKSELTKLPAIEIESKRMLLELEQETEVLAALKERYEWSVLVESMSKAASSIIVTRKPELLKKEEYSDPNLLINVLIALAVSFTLCCIAVIAMEAIDEKLTYNDIEDYFIVVNSNKVINIPDVEAEIIANNYKNISILTLCEKNKSDKFISKINSIKLDFNNELNVSITSLNSSLSDHINNLKTAQLVLLLVQCGITEKTLFRQLSSISLKLNQKTKFILLK